MAKFSRCRNAVVFRFIK